MPVIVVRVTVGKPTIGPEATLERSDASQVTLSMNSSGSCLIPQKTDAGVSAAQTDEDNDDSTSRVQKSAKKRKMSGNDAPSGEKQAISKDTVPINGSEATCEPGATTDSAQKKGVKQANAGGEKKGKRKKDSDEAEPPQGSLAHESVVNKSPTFVTEKSKKKKAKAADHDATTSEAAPRSTGPPEATTSELPQDVQAASNVTKPEKLKKSKRKSKTSSAVVEDSGDEAGPADDRLVNPRPFAEQLAEVIAQAGGQLNFRSYVFLADTSTTFREEQKIADAVRGASGKEKYVFTVCLVYLCQRDCRARQKREGSQTDKS